MQAAIHRIYDPLRRLDDDNIYRKLQGHWIIEMPEDTNVGIIQAWLDNYKDDYVCSRMIYRDALGRDSDNPKQWELQEIGNIMNNSIEGWEKGPQHRFADYGQQRCWKRTKPRGEFLPMPDDAELPFK